MSDAPNILIKPYLIFLSLSVAISVVCSKTVNVTVDDQSGDARLIYAPVENWNEGPQCLTNLTHPCGVHPDPSQAYNGTWYDSTIGAGEQPSNITYSFNG